MNIHYIKYNNDKEVAFFAETKRFFKINKLAKLLINDIQVLTKSEIIEKYKITDDDYNLYMSYISVPNNITNCTSSNNEINSKKRLSRLVIHLTNDCNLRCRYCYADGGDYGSNREILNKKMLDKILETFFNEFDIIDGIQFFGGEPLMNIPLLKKTCEFVTNINKEKNFKTNFGLVTNGTILNNDIINLINKYNIGVTVSYDGNPLVNDIMRIDENNNPTSNKIIKNIKKLKESTGQPNTIEVTYNQYHVDNGVSILDVVKHIQEISPETYVHLVPAGGSSDSDFTVKNLNIFPESIYEIYDFINNHKLDAKENYTIPSYSLADRIFSALANKDSDGSPYICDAGLGTISVSTKGNIYPCFMFTDQEELCYGNVMDDNVFNSSKAINMNNKLFSFSIKNNNPECQNCFIKKICNGCLGLNSFHSGDPFKLSKEICKMFQDMTEAAIICHINQLEIAQYE